MDERIRGGFEVILREAKYGKPRSWKRHKKLVDQVLLHILACGGNPDDYLPLFKRQLAEAMNL